jgi:hypothetical protein
MIVIKATTGCFTQGDFDPDGQPTRDVEDPIIFYKCPNCGVLEEKSTIKIRGADGRGGR